MACLEQYSDSVTRRSLRRLSEQLYKDILPGERLILIINTVDRDINVKELSSYLELIYRIDGFLSKEGHARYVQRRSDQIHVNQIRTSSIEYIIERLLESREAAGLFVMFLALKFLLQIINTAADSTSKFYDILLKHEDLLEKRDRRRFRKHIRDVINEEVELVNLDRKSKGKLVDLLDEIYMRNGRNVVPASRFARHYVKKVKLARKSSNESEG